MNESEEEDVTAWTADNGNIVNPRANAVHMILGFIIRYIKNYNI